MLSLALSKCLLECLKSYLQLWKRYNYREIAHPDNRGLILDRMA